MTEESQSGLLFRPFMTKTTASAHWAFLVDKDENSFIPVITLLLHKGILAGLAAKELSVNDCGIYTSTLHTWMSFGISPEYIEICMELTKVDGEVTLVSKPYIQLKQDNEMGMTVSRVLFSIPDAIIFSVILDTPIIVSGSAVESIGVKLAKDSPIEDQISAYIADYEAGSSDQTKG
jgi:hypothetical protein